MKITLDYKLKLFYKADIIKLFYLLICSHTKRNVFNYDNAEITSYRGDRYYSTVIPRYFQSEWYFCFVFLKLDQRLKNVQVVFIGNIKK